MDRIKKILLLISFLSPVIEPTASELDNLLWRTVPRLKREEQIVFIKHFFKDKKIILVQASLFEAIKLNIYYYRITGKELNTAAFCSYAIGLSRSPNYETIVKSSALVMDFLKRAEKKQYLADQRHFLSYVCQTDLCGILDILTNNTYSFSKRQAIADAVITLFNPFITDEYKNKALYRSFRPFEYLDDPKLIRKLTKKLCNDFSCNGPPTKKQSLTEPNVRCEHITELFYLETKNSVFTENQCIDCYCDCGEYENFYDYTTNRYLEAWREASGDFLPMGLDWEPKSAVD